MKLSTTQQRQSTQLNETDVNIRSSPKDEDLSHCWHFKATDCSKQWVNWWTSDWLQHYRPFGGCKNRRGQIFCRHCGKYLQKLPLLQIFVDNRHCHFSLLQLYPNQTIKSVQYSRKNQATGHCGTFCDHLVLRASPVNCSAKPVINDYCCAQPGINDDLRG